MGSNGPERTISTQGYGVLNNIVYHCCNAFCSVPLLQCFLQCLKMTKVESKTKEDSRDSIRRRK